MTINLPSNMTAKQKADFINTIIAPLGMKALPFIKEITFNPKRAGGIGHLVYTYSAGEQVELLATPGNLSVVLQHLMICYRAHCLDVLAELKTGRRYGVHFFFDQCKSFDARRGEHLPSWIAQVSCAKAG